LPSKFAARRYARALFELGLAGNKLEKWQADIEKVAALSRDPEVAAFLAYPRVSLKDKIGLLSRNLGGVSPEVLNLTYLLIKEGAADRLDIVANSYHKMVDAHNGIERGRLTTAILLTESDVQDLSRRVGTILNKRVVLAGEVAPELLGGFQARVAGKLLDGSTSTALAALKKELS
jgi:F-type H+-transporting ATPase subunit delta